MRDEIASAQGEEIGGAESLVGDQFPAYVDLVGRIAAPVTGGVLTVALASAASTIASLDDEVDDSEQSFADKVLASARRELLSLNRRLCV